MEGSDSDSETPYVDINSFLELGIKSDNTPITTTATPKINGNSERDPLLITSPTKTINKRSPARRPAIAFVDVSRILEQPKLLPRLPSSITLTRNMTPQPRYSTVPKNTNNSTRPQLNNNIRRLQPSPQRKAIRPQLNPRLINTPVRSPLNNRLLNNTLCPQINPGLPNITISPVIKPQLPTNLKLPNNTTNRVHPQNPRPRNAMIPQINSWALSSVIRSQVTIRPLRNNPQPNTLRPLLNPRLYNCTLRPRFNAPAQSCVTRPQPFPRFSENSTKRQPNRYLIERFRQRAPVGSLAPVASLAPHIQTINAIRAKTGVTLVPLRLPAAATPTAGTPTAGTSQAPNIPIAVRPNLGGKCVKTEPGLRSLKRRCSPEDNACNICLHIFTHRKSLRRHMRSAHKNVMNELPARKSTRISKDSHKSMADPSSSSEQETDDNDDVEVLPTPVMEPKVLVNLSDEELANLSHDDEGDNEGDNEEIMDISQFLEVSLTQTTSLIKKPLSKQLDYYENPRVFLPRLPANVYRTDISYTVCKVGNKYCFKLPRETQSCIDPVVTATLDNDTPPIIEDAIITESPACENLETSEASKNDFSPCLQDAGLQNVEDDIISSINGALPHVEEDVLNVDVNMLDVDGIMPSVDVNMLDVDDIMPSVEVLLSVDGDLPNVDGFLPNIDDVLPCVEQGSYPFVCDCCQARFANDHLLIEHLKAHLAEVS